MGRYNFYILISKAKYQTHTQLYSTFYELKLVDTDTPKSETAFCGLL